MFSAVKSLSLAVVFGLLTVACQPDTPPPASTAPAVAESGLAEPEKNLIHPQDWPLQTRVMVRDPAVEQRVNDLLARMTLEEKVGQLMQAERKRKRITMIEMCRQFHLHQCHLIFVLVLLGARWNAQLSKIVSISRICIPFRWAH